MGSEAELGEVEKVLLYISEARERASRVAEELGRGGAPDHLITAVKGSEASLEADHRRLMQATFFAVSDDVRSDATRARDASAGRRDRVSDRRDVVARGRDRLAAAADSESQSRAPARNGGAAGDRKHAADDRKHAAGDRKQAAGDRQASSEELAMAHVDYLTGALRRRAGLAAIQREMDRTSRSHEPLVLAFADVDGLKAINDTQGHQAADDVLRKVARCVRESLRSYDVTVRFGGDEFICSLAGQDAAGAQKRFEQVSAQLAETSNNVTITVGFAERQADESLDDLISRADDAMIATRTRERERPG